MAYALQTIHALIETLDLAPEDIFPAAKPRRRTSLNAPKYCDPKTGRMWTGRGRLPDWIKDKDRTQFAIP